MTAAEGGDTRKLRILLIAYEFPPSPSPQSLRWAYLTNRLAALGHEVHVMAPDIGGSMEGLPDPGPDVQVHRTWPGPVRALLGWLARRHPIAPQVVTAITGTQKPSQTGGALDLPSGAEPPRLNWKGRLLEHFQRGVSWFLFPDLRAEWKGPALRALPELLTRLQPDVVVSSHEPATTLELGLEAKHRGYPWVADLGDPVLAPYTPRRWRRRARELEARVLDEADHVLVTAEPAATLLHQRHGGIVPVSLVTQGFDEQFPSISSRPNMPQATLELLYAGTFYVFRDPRALVNAVLDVPGVRLNIAGGNLPPWMQDVAARHPESLRLLGRVAHRQLLALQREVDVLVNLANADPSQIPGKFYEYLGAGRPVLHLLADDEPDTTAVLLQKLRRGTVSRPNEIRQNLEQMALAQSRAELEAGLDLGPAAAERWSWTASGSRLDGVLRGIAARCEEQRQMGCTDGC